LFPPPGRKILLKLDPEESFICFGFAGAFSFPLAKWRAVEDMKTRERTHAEIDREASFIINRASSTEGTRRDRRSLPAKNRRYHEQPFPN